LRLGDCRAFCLAPSDAIAGWLGRTHSMDNGDEILVLLVVLVSSGALMPAS
jgi:hypothetical protein